MKKLILPFLAIAALVVVSACKTDEVTHSTTTTTDQTSMQRPVGSVSTTETRSSN